MRIAYLSPSFDISDAWERVFWSMQGRLEELGVDFEVQQLAVASHVDHAGQLAQVESVIAGRGRLRLPRSDRVRGGNSGAAKAQAGRRSDRPSTISRHPMRTKWRGQ